MWRATCCGATICMRSHGDAGFDCHDADRAAAPRFVFDRALVAIDQAARGSCERGSSGAPSAGIDALAY
jgi:hypothetical protein